jgi:hypothetical protein
LFCLSCSACSARPALAVENQSSAKIKERKSTSA